MDWVVITLSAYSLGITVMFIGHIHLLSHCEEEIRDLKRNNDYLADDRDRWRNECVKARQANDRYALALNDPDYKMQGPN